MLQENDSLELLRLLERYDFLLEQLQKTMGEGFSQLCRANYYNKDSLRGRYGSDYWDERYQGHLTVRINGDTVIVKPKEDKGKLSLEKEPEKGGDSLRRRHGEEKLKNVTLAKKKDPIMMFGGALSIPTALRKSQSHFRASIPLMAELINCRRAIQSIIHRNETSLEIK